MFVLAEKNGRRKKFTREAWENLGTNTNGYTLVIEVNQIAENEVAIPEPPSGQVQKIEDQIVENQVAKNDTVDQLAKNNLETKTETPNVDEVDQDEFYQLAKNNLKRATLKDYLDINHISYKQNDTHDALIEILSGTLENNIEKLKSEFVL